MELGTSWPKTTGGSLGAKDEDAGHVGSASFGLVIGHENGGSDMLVLSRRNSESVIVGAPNGVERLLKVTVLDIHAGSVRLGFEAGSDFPIHRWEVWQRILAGSRLRNGPSDMEDTDE